MKLCCCFVGKRVYGSWFIYVVYLISFLIGLLGNILSATVWFRARIAAKNSSAIYLGSLAIVDLVSVCWILVYKQLLAGVKGISDVYRTSYMLYYLGAAFILAVSLERVVIYRFPSLVSWPLFPSHFLLFLFPHLAFLLAVYLRVFMCVPTSMLCKAGSVVLVASVCVSVCLCLSVCLCV